MNEVPTCPQCSRRLARHKPTGDLHCNTCCLAWEPGHLELMEQERRRAAER